MAGQQNISDIVRIRHWPAYRDRHGLEVVRVVWPRGAAMPTLFCRPLSPAAAMVAPGQTDAEQPPIDQQEA